MQDELVLEKRIQRELDKLDGGLFLDKLRDPYGRIYYTVSHIVEVGTAPYVAVEWRYFDGSPRPLSMEIIDQVHRQEGDIREELKRAMVENAVLAEKRHQDLLNIIEDGIKEHF